ncbi:MAG: DNA N-6-adenine-methyltransferase [Candidatus Dormiibacterota bacterium]
MSGEPAGPRMAHVAHNSGDQEWYTPPEYVEAAKRVMGAIDLDPASCATANKAVGAPIFYTAEDDGLTQSWQGRVWMNPPYGRGVIGRFTAKLVAHHSAGEVTEACVLVNNATETKWWQELGKASAALCLPRRRVKFWHPEKLSAPLQGQVVFYLGPNVKAFQREFRRFGVVGTK